MHPANPHASRRTRALSLGGLAVAALLLAAGSLQAQYSTPPITVGLKYFMTANDLNGFLADSRTLEGATPLDLLAAEAELSGHERLGAQLIEGSTAMEHWALGNGDEEANPAKSALRAGGVNVFMVSPGPTMPDTGIDRFGDLMIETNPQGRILVQSAWSGPADGPGGAAGEAGRARAVSDEDRDAGWGTIQGWIDELHAEGGYLERLRTQLMGINERAGSTIAYLVPAAEAVYRLRQEALLGRIPGIERQSDLVLDAEGQAGTPIVNLVSYVWFVAMYQQPADGLTALVDPDDPSSAARERLLQRLAWDVTFNEPMGGLEVGLLWPNGVRGKHELLHQMSQEGQAHDSGHGNGPGH